MKNRIRNVLSLLTLAGVCFVAYWYVREHREEFYTVQLVSWRYYVLVALCFTANLSFRGLFEFSVLRAINVRLTLVESMQLSAVATMTNLVLPFRSGAALRAIYLKRLYGLKLMLFATTMTALHVFFIFVNCLLGMAALALLTDLHEPLSLEIFSVLAVLFLSSGWAIFFAPSVPKGNGPLSNYVSRISHGWDQIRRSRRILFTAMGTMAGISACASLGLYGAFRAFGYDIGARGSVLMMASQHVGSLVSLTPGAVGFQEAAGVLFARVLSVTTVETLLVLGAARIVKVGVALLVGMPSFVILSNRMYVEVSTNKDDA